MDQISEQFLRDTFAFVEWFTDAPATRLNPKLDLADLRDAGAGRGVVAKADIAKDEELFAIPRSLTLDTTNSDLQTQIDSPLSQFGSWSSLVLVIIYEYLRKDASPWYPYFKVLPGTFNTLMFWNQAELAELQGSAVLEKIGRAEAEEGWKTSVIPFMKAHPALFPATKTGAKVNFVGLAHMAGSLIMAYAFDLGKGDDTEEDADEDGFVEDDEEDPEKGMVPFADMLNADADRNNAHLFHEDDFLIMKANRAIVAGDEIFNDYGPLPRSDLLRMYGYVTDNYARYDVVELSSQIIYDVAQQIRKRNKRPETTVPRLEDLSNIEEGYSISRPSTDMELDDTIPGDLRQLLSALAVDPEPAVSANNIFGLGEQNFSSASAILLACTIRKRLADYKTTVSEDDNLLGRLRNSSGAQGASGVNSSRYRMAVQVRKGEKEILQHVLELARQFSTSKADGKRKRDTEDTGPKNKNKTKATG